MLQKADPRPTVLLTGFGPFPGVPVNASAELVRKVVRVARRASPAVRFVSAVLPTEWQRAPVRIGALHMRYRPVVALHFGVASNTDIIRLESRAENVCRPSPDAAGRLPLSALLCTGGPDERVSTIDIGAISESLKTGRIPVAVSDDAGGYLCNAVLYQSIATAEARGEGAVGFIHIPVDLSVTPQKMTDAVDAVLRIIDVCVAASRADIPQSA